MPFYEQERKKTKMCVGSNDWHMYAEKGYIFISLKSCHREVNLVQSNVEKMSNVNNKIILVCKWHVWNINGLQDKMFSFVELKTKEDEFDSIILWSIQQNLTLYYLIWLYLLPQFWEHLPILKLKNKNIFKNV